MVHPDTGTEWSLIKGGIEHFMLWTHSRDGGKRALSDIVFWPIHIIYILQYRMYDWNEMLYTIEEMYWTVNLIYPP